MQSANPAPQVAVMLWVGLAFYLFIGVVTLYSLYKESKDGNYPS